MVVRDPDSKRRAMLDAALKEFAAHGVAGARMERIARDAGCSTGLLYAYFESKDGLYEAVVEAAAERMAEQIPFTPEDLPGYAAHLHEARSRAGDTARLNTWYRLERGGAPAPAQARQAEESRVEAVRRAQDSGLVRRRFAADHLLALVEAIGSMWSTLPPEALNPDSPDEERRRRQSVVDAVRLLTDP